MYAIVGALPDYDIVLPSSLDVHRDRIPSLSIPHTDAAVVQDGLSESICALWADLDLQNFVRHIPADESQVLNVVSPTDPSVAIYYFESLGRILSEDYIPTSEDVMMLHHRTSQVEELILESGSMTRRIIDPGGAARKDETKNWLHQFSHVTTVIFMLSLSDYDSYREHEDYDTPVIVSACRSSDYFEVNLRHLQPIPQEAFNTFDAIANLKWFQTTNTVNNPTCL